MKGLNLSIFTPSTDLDEIQESEILAKGYVALTDDELKAFDGDIDKLLKKGETSAITQEEYDSLEKAIRDRSKLVKKIVVRKDGHKTTKWVRMSEAESNKDSVKNALDNKSNKSNSDNEFIVSNRIMTSDIDKSKRGKSVDKVLFERGDVIKYDKQNGSITIVTGSGKGKEISISDRAFNMLIGWNKLSSGGVIDLSGLVSDYIEDSGGYYIQTEDAYGLNDGQRVTWSTQTRGVSGSKIMTGIFHKKEYSEPNQFIEGGIMKYHIIKPDTKRKGKSGK